MYACTHVIIICTASYNYILSISLHTALQRHIIVSYYYIKYSLSYMRGDPPRGAGLEEQRHRPGSEGGLIIIIIIIIAITILINSINTLY